MVYRLSTFHDICSKSVKHSVLLNTVERRRTVIDEDNTVCVAKICGHFLPENILKQIDGEFIGEKTFEELCIILELLNDVKKQVDLEGAFSSIHIDFNGLTILCIVNNWVASETSLVLDVNEFMRQLHLAMKPTFIQRWSHVLSIVGGFLAGVGATSLFLQQTRIKY